MKPLEIFDNTGTSLMWMHENKKNDTKIYFYNLQSSKLHWFDITQWIINKYGENMKDTQIQKRNKNASGRSEEEW